MKRWVSKVMKSAILKSGRYLSIKGPNLCSQEPRLVQGPSSIRAPRTPQGESLPPGEPLHYNFIF